jgi:peptidoglycan/xylan/chitin deacetylase (PgdA/CDA1 family)
MSGTILLGYDVETASESTEGFLAGALEFHARHAVPWTVYVTGQTLERCGDAIRRAAESPLLILGQHTYSHALLKSVVGTPGDGQPMHGAYPTFFKAGIPLDEIPTEIGRTQALYRDVLGRDCRGLTAPWGYYRGLADRPDILQILYENGIRWIRTYARDWRDCQPTPFTVQPFFYREQGFPEILELGVQGYQDQFYWERFDDRRYGETYQDYLYAMLAEIAAQDWVWNICSHDHGTPTAAAFHEGPGAWLEDLIVRAKSLGIRFVDPETFYGELLGSGGASGSV